MKVNSSPAAKSVSKNNFVRSGSTVAKRKAKQPESFGLLEAAHDWECDFDLPEYRLDEVAVCLSS